MISVENLFTREVTLNGNFILFQDKTEQVNQNQTNEAFSEKWKKVETKDNVKDLEDFQLQWYLKLYGFENETELQKFLQSKKVIIDAGCGLGYKTAWFARLAPESLVIGMDFSDACKIAASKYKEYPNLYFIKGDIANTFMHPGSVDYVSCDQVIMHTENPENTFSHLSQLLQEDGEFACYVYSKKALPRELLDDYFRLATHTYSSDQLWEMSAQLTELGKRLSELNVKFESPDIPLLGIKGGVYDIQRFIYWNFLKCFWRSDWSRGLCDSTNFDWYSPSNAKRYSKQEFFKMAIDNKLTIKTFHEEEACYSGRFAK